MPTDARFPRIAIVDVPGKGKGVIAKEYILRGTLIVSEKPKITLPATPAAALEALFSMSQDGREFLESFPCGPDENPILGRLKHFTPCIGDGTVGLCPTICRVNHTCHSPKGSPNAAYFWNNRAKVEELRAIKEIQEGQEIEVSYMEDIENYKDPLVQLRQKFGFECSCQGCTRSPAQRTKSKERIRAYNEFVDRLPARFGLLNDPLQILKDIEAQILIICEEGYTGEVGKRAHDAFQLCAYYGDADSARHWEAICRDSHALYQGPESEEFDRARKLAAKPETFRAWQGLGRRKLRGPSKQVLEYCYPEVEEPQVVPEVSSDKSLNKASSSVVPPSATADDTVIEPSTSVTQKLTKGQKKKARVKAKKAAAKQADEEVQ